MTNLTPVALWRLWLEPNFFPNMMKLIYMIEYSITNRMNQNMASYHENLREKMSIVYSISEKTLIFAKINAVVFIRNPTIHAALCNWYALCNCQICSKLLTKGSSISSFSIPFSSFKATLNPRDSFNGNQLMIDMIVFAANSPLRTLFWRCWCHFRWVNNF